MSRDAWVWGLCTLLAAALCIPVDWRIAVLCLLGAAVGRGRLWLATCAAPLWMGAVLTGHSLSAVLLLWAMVKLTQHPRGWPLLLLGLWEGLRVGGLSLEHGAGAEGGEALVLAGVLLGGLFVGSPPSGGRPALLLAAIMICAGAVVTAGETSTRGEITSARRAGVLRWQPPTSDALKLWAIREDPLWHGLAMQLPPEQALAAGWFPEGAPLDDEHRAATGRVLERWGRGGEALRLLSVKAGPLSQWWKVYFLRGSGMDAQWFSSDFPADVLVIGRVDEGVEVDVRFVTNGVKELPLHVLEPSDGLMLTASADWFEGAPALEVWLDGVQSVLTPEQNAGVHRISQHLDAGPHRLVLRFSDDAFSDVGDRNIYVHRLGVFSR